MLADALRRCDPRDRRERALARCPVEVAERLDVAELVVLLHRVEARQRVPDARSRRALWYVPAEHLAVRAVGLAAVRDVVAPAHVVAVQEVRQIRPRIVELLAVARGSERRLQGRLAAHRVVVLRAARRPAGHHREMGREAPRVDRLEHVVLEDEVARVVPVVRDLVPVVVAHHVGSRGRERAAGVVGGVTREEAPYPGLPLEAVHLPVIDVAHRVDRVVRAAGVAVGRVVVRLDADVRLRVGVADGRHAVLHRDPVGAGERAEVGVEGAVLLHDDHDVADLVDPPRERPRAPRVDGPEARPTRAARPGGRRLQGRRRGAASKRTQPRPCSLERNESG